MGLLLLVVVTTAAISDPAGARRLFARLGGVGKKLRRIWVDGTYRGTLVDWVLDHCWFMSENEGHDVGIGIAAEHYLSTQRELGVEAG